jgi:hypothetical protein
MSAVGQANPFSDASEFNTLAFIIDRATEEMQTVSIVQVKAVNTGAQTVDVQVLVNLMTGANISVPHGVISARPYFRAQGGTSGIILDPVVGDIGVMVFASRDSSAVISAKGLANPGSKRRFSWSDGVYFGGVLNTPPTQYVKLNSSGITILSPTAVLIQSPANMVSGPLAVSGATTLQATLHVIGNVQMDGTLNVNGIITSGTEVSAPIGSFGSLVVSTGPVTVPAASIPTSALGPSGVTAGSYTNMNATVNAAGIITAAANGSSSGSPLTTKGDLFGYSTTVARVPIGSNGQVLTADSTQALGLKWAIPSSGSLSITDGTTTVAGTTSLTVVGGVVSGATPNATLTIAGGSPGIPATIPDLCYWWQADIPLTTVGYPIQRLVDSGPSSQNHAGFQSGSGVVLSATQLNGKNVYTWPGATSGRVFFSTPIYLPKSTMFFVVRTKASGTQAFNISGPNGAYQIGQDSTNNKIALVKAAVIIIGESSALAPNTAVQFNATYDGTTGNYAIRISQANDSSGTNFQTITNVTNSFGFNAASGAEDIVGDTAELVIYDRILTLTEIQSVESYLHTKWGV